MIGQIQMIEPFEPVAGITERLKEILINAKHLETSVEASIKCHPYFRDDAILSALSVTRDQAWADLKRNFASWLNELEEIDLSLRKCCVNIYRVRDETVKKEIINSPRPVISMTEDATIISMTGGGENGNH